MLQPEEIADLADHLRREGYQSTLHQAIAAQTVVRQESLQDSGLGSLVRLVTVLRPIFSSTPDEQARFEKLYLEWLRARSDRPRKTSASSPSLPPPEPPHIHWRMKLAVPCLLIVPVLTAWFLWQDLRAREAVGRVVADSQAVALVSVKLGDRIVATDEQGRFQVPFKNDDMPLPLLVEMKGYVPSQSQVGQPILENRKWFYLSPIEWDTRYQIGDVQLAKETAPVTLPSPPSAPLEEPILPKLSLEKLRTVPPPVPAWWERLSYSTALMALAPSLLVLPWLLYRLSRRAVLKRQSSRIPPELKQIQVHAGTQRLFPSLSLRHVTQRLRQTRFEESVELDVARTIQRTMRRGGLFTPVFGSKHEPSYVALIDRATVADHQANVAAQVVKDLAKGYVLVRQYEFDEQPTMLRKVDPLHTRPKQSEGATAVVTMVEVMSLGEITAKFPTSRLLCFAEPMTCFDPLTGKIRPWVEDLEAWEERFLFTPGIRVQWGQAERILSRRGFHVIPLTHLGLRLFSHLLEQDSPQGGSATETTRERRGIYERTPQRWLERHPPSQETIVKLMADLRQELGSEGMLWLAACAAYPEIHWALTLEWGVRLFGSGHIAESLLPKLTPLIWFRHAFMPDWFRTALHDQLTAQQAERISEELGEIISALNPETGNTLQLKIATPSGAKQQAPHPVGRFSAWFQKFRRRSAIQAMGHSAEPGSPMRDYVMLQYLSGKQGKALTPYAPKALLALLFPKGQPWLGFRPLFLIMAAVLMSTGLWWWKNPAPLPIPSPISDIGFLPDATEVILKRENGQVERWGEKEQELVRLESGVESAFADRLTKVKMGQLTVSDPTNTLELTYGRVGELRVISHGDGRELAREPAPAAQLASLHWPSGADALLVVGNTDVPELEKLKGLENLRQDKTATSANGKRVAFVIGIGTYDNLSVDKQLRTAVNDAEGVSAKLSQIGYHVVKALNPTRSAFIAQWEKVLDTLTEEDTLVLFYSGHAVQIVGQGYLLPRDIPYIEYGRQAQLTREAISLNELLADLLTGDRSHPRNSVVILDACRDNPLIPPDYKGLSAPGSRANLPQYDGLFVLYAAASNRVSLDRLSSNDKDKYSVFTRTLLPLMGRRDLSIQELSNLLKEEVWQLTKSVGREQRPTYFDTIHGRFCLPGCSARERAPSLSEPEQPNQIQERLMKEAHRSSDPMQVEKPPLTTVGKDGVSAALASHGVGGKRVAFAVGIEKYDNLPSDRQLSKAVNDAEGVSAKLNEIGFRVVKAANLTRYAFNMQWQNVLDSFTEDDTFVLYFSGYGVQIAGQNYLLPRDIPFIEYGRDERLRREAISLNEILMDLSSGNRPHPKHSIVIVDASRDNPFIPPGYNTSATPKEFATIPEYDGIFILYAAASNQVPLDRLSIDDKDKYSVFTRTLLPLMGRRDLTIQELSMQLSEEVWQLAKNAGHKQRPEYHDGILGRFCLPGCTDEARVAP